MVFVYYQNNVQHVEQCDCMPAGNCVWMKLRKTWLTNETLFYPIIHILWTIVFLSIG